MITSFYRPVALLIVALCCSTISAEINLDKMFPNLVVSRYHYTIIKGEISKRPGNNIKGAFVSLIENEVTSAVEKDKKPTPFVSLTNKPNGADADDDMNLIYKLCVAYLFREDERYLNKAIEYLEAWAKINVAVKNYNIHETVYTPAIEGYSIIRNIINEESRKKIDSWVEARGNVFLSDNIRVNNWGTALLHQCLAFGRCLNKATLINKFKNNYPTWVKGNLYPNGTGEDLIGRDAFAYHSYNLLFFGRIGYTIAMYEGWEKADEFYSQDVNWGASVKKTVHFWIPFLMDPAKNVHLEFVNTEWAPDKNRSDYNKPYNPGGTVYAVDELFFFDKENLQPVIDKYRGKYYFGQWRLMLGAMRHLYGDYQPINN